ELGIRTRIVGVRVDGLDHLHRLDVEHRQVGMAARESMSGLGIDDRAVAAAVEDFAERLERLEIEYRRAARHRLARRSTVRRRYGANRIACDVQATTDGIG